MDRELLKSVPIVRYATGCSNDGCTCAHQSSYTRCHSYKSASHHAQVTAMPSSIVVVVAVFEEIFNNLFEGKFSRFVKIPTTTRFTYHGWREDAP
jgi:hypothetical protein